MPIEFSTQLNERQLEAVEHTAGPLLILAGAGSGKTRTITYKIAYLVEQGLASSEDILAVTFTNKAAGEMKERVERLLRLRRSPLICTFHSFGVRTLRRFAHRIGFRRDFTICDVDDQKRLLKQVYKQIGFVDDDLPLEKARWVISRAKNQGWTPERYLEMSRDFDAERIFEVFTAYQDLLKRSNAFDFDDLIGKTVELLSDDAEVRKYFSSRYGYLLIDEYQDTNVPQCDLVRLLTSEHDNVTAVGDEDQAIYGFRGADIGNILRFERDFPGAKIVKLEENYRSTQTILDAATAVVSNNLHRKGKTLWTRGAQGGPLTLYVADDAFAEADFIAREIERHLRSGTRGIAVLYRTNFQSRQLEDCLRRRSIPYRLIGGVSFYQRKEVRDALAYLRVVMNSRDDVSLGRILNEPPRGLGQVTRDRLIDLATSEELPLYEAVEKAVAEQLFPARAHMALKRFLEMMDNAREHLTLPLHALLEKVLDESGYIDALKANDSEEDANRLLNLQELVNVARDYEDADESIEEFLDQAALHADIDELDDEADVLLMTLHNAKGLEFPVVFMAGCEEGLFPHSRAVAEDDLEEERRLCYVGMTRAMERLYLSYSRRRRFFGREGNELNQPSRFLHEIPPELLDATVSTPYGGRAQSHRPVFLTEESLERPRRRRQENKYSGPTYNSVESVRQALEERRTKRSGDSGLVTGALIVHESFGKGRVMKVEPAGSDLKVTVQFPGLGVKKLLQSRAKLRPA